MPSSKIPNRRNTKQTKEGEKKLGMMMRWKKNPRARATPCLYLYIYNNDASEVVFVNFFANSQSRYSPTHFFLYRRRMMKQKFGNVPQRQNNVAPAGRIYRLSVSPSFRIFKGNRVFFSAKARRRTHTNTNVGKVVFPPPRRESKWTKNDM